MAVRRERQAGRRQLLGHLSTLVNLNPSDKMGRPSMRGVQVKVVVVGAGFAGLMAAVDLTRAGHHVDVFEARGRVGGRVWSELLDPDDPETMIERGAEFILDGYELMRSMLDWYALGLAPTGMSYYVREPHGVDTTSEDVAACAAVVAERAGTCHGGRRWPPCSRTSAPTWAPVL